MSYNYLGFFTYLAGYCYLYYSFVIAYNMRFRKKIENCVPAVCFFPFKNDLYAKTTVEKNQNKNKAFWCIPILPLGGSVSLELLKVSLNCPKIDWSVIFHQILNRMRSLFTWMLSYRDFYSNHKMFYVFDNFWRISLCFLTSI